MAEPTASIRSAPQAQPDPLLGRVINDRFRILSVIARGGMGKVYRAEQAPLGRIVALKVLQPNYKGENDPEFDKRFFLEASIVSKLHHPHTVTLYDYGQTTDGVYFMAMEYLEGRTLQRLLRDEGAVEPARALRMLLQTCRALREAHGLGVIHRDLKPANIFLIEHDEDPDFVKVLDFGLLKRTDEDPDEALTQTGLFMGSPKYMAPEQIRGERVSPATDVYSLGVILYEMLTGKVPFDRPSSVNLLMAHVTDPVPALGETNPAVSVTPAVEALVYRCLAKSPDERFASMNELIAAVKTAVPTGLTGFSTGTGEFASSGPSPMAASLFTSGEHPASLHSLSPSVTPPPLPSATLHPADHGDRSHNVDALDLADVAEVTTASLAAPTAPRRTLPFVLGGALVLALLSALAWVGLRPPAVGPSPTLAAPSRPSPAGLRVSLDSDPPGAEVFEAGVSLGHTPLHAVWEGRRADPDLLHSLVFRAPGHRDHEVTLAGRSLVYSATLEPETTADAGVVVQTNTVNTVQPAQVDESQRVRRVRSGARRPRTGTSPGETQTQTQTQTPTRNAQGLYNNVY